MEQILEQLRDGVRGIANTTAHFMELAESYLSTGEVETARACLVLLCEYCDNYEESLAFNGLTEQWEKHRHLVDGLVAPSISFHTCAPNNETMDIQDILSLPEDELLPALSEHLAECSDGGEKVNRLNQWERIVFYVDELWCEVNSGGFDGYLYYHGTHFDKAYAALEAISADAIVQLLDAIRDKFPKKHIPKNEERLQDTLDAMEEKGVSFEAEEDAFYTFGEQELQKRLFAYVKDNEKHFR